MRSDLLALTDDDLVALANRGNVRRARQELETLTVALTEADDGTVTARWSDESECVLPAGKPLAQGRCTCPAEPPCRHLLRTVMAYQSSVPPRPNPLSPIIGGGEARAGGNPAGGTASARKLYEAGQLFELIRSAKPIARCHGLGTVTRFLVPGDPNFAVCDCGQPVPCDHAWMALWAFEQLPPGATSGLVDTRTEPYPMPTAALDALDALVSDLLQVGVAGATEALWARLQRSEEQCRRAGLVWPAECLAELVVLQEAYRAQDARFDPVLLAQTVGELVLRSATIRADRGAVPPLFVRGTAVDRAAELGSVKLIGLGYGGRVLRSGLQLTAFLQDEDTGSALVITASTAHRALTKGVTLAAAAAGRVLVRGGKRAPSGVFTFSRAPVALHPQSFAWERLRAPVLMEGFAETDAHLSLLPPRPLRPRRLAEDFHVVPVAEVIQVGFDTVAQSVIARLRDAQGEEAWLVHPFHHRCALGAEALLTALQGGGVRFVAGAFRRGASGLTVAPTALVVEENGVRSLVLPWEEGAAPSRAAGPVDATPDETDFLTAELLPALGELLLLGGEGRSERTESQWRERARQAQSLGFVQLPPLLEALAQGEREALGTLLALAALARES